MKIDWGLVIIVLLVILAFLGVAWGLWYMATNTEHVEGEVLWKEDRQQAFMSSTPDMFMINGTGMVSVDAETYHSYEVGDYFNESVPLRKLQPYREREEMLEFILPLMMVIATLAIVPRILFRRGYL